MPSKLKSVMDRHLGELQKLFENMGTDEGAQAVPIPKPKVAKKYAAKKPAVEDEVKKQVDETTERPTEWVFDMVRDGDGVLTQIKASAN